MNSNDYEVYVGLDVHKDTIAVATAAGGRSKPEFRGEIRNEASAVRRLVKRLGKGGKTLSFCYEAGPCGYGVYWQIQELNYPCAVVAPSLIPRRPGDRVKTDRRDALNLARLHRTDDLTAVWVPDAQQEAVRDLARAREDAKSDELQARHRLSAFLLRHRRVYREGKTHWTKKHVRWLEEQVFDSRPQQIVFQEYQDVVRERQDRVAGLTEQLRQAQEGWSLGPLAQAMMALRGIDLITAMTLLSELGDISRFDTPVQLMGFLGLVPSEHSSGGQRRSGSITKAGNRHVRRCLVEAAWSYRFQARKTAYLQKRAAATSAEVQAIAWTAQKRLCGRYRKLALEKGKPTPKVCVAIARELTGFLWAIACEVNGKPYTMRAH